MEVIEEDEHRLAQFCQAFSNALRVKLVLLLRSGEECVKELAEKVDREQSVVSRHLRKLVARGLLRSKARGRKNFYRIKRTDLVEELLELVSLLRREAE